MSEFTPAPVQIVAVHGRGVLPADATVVTADDLGLTRGDGCFDATRVSTASDGGSVVDNLEAHLARLNRSVVGLGDPADDLDLWRALVGQAVEAWTTSGEAVLKLMYTRGAETVHGEPTRLLTITQMGEDAITQRDGLKVVTLARGYASDTFADAPWLLGGVKTLSYAVNKASLREAARRGADDCLWTSSDGYLLEGPSSSVIAWIGDELVTTPTGATGILESITRTDVFAAAQAEGVATAERLMRPEELATAKGSWLVSSGRGAAPIVTLDGVALPQDAEMTRRMQEWAGF